MTMVFLSNYFNYHQAALADALWEQTGGKFLFVETESMPTERKKLGLEALRRQYVLPLQGNEKRVFQALGNADVVIAGSTPEWLIRKRIQTGKLLFRYLERPLRKGMEPLKWIPRWLRWHWRNPPGKPIYLLCASAYTAGDFARFGLFRGRAFRWGYFPETREYSQEALFSEKGPTQILWCGRFLELKHPLHALAAAAQLKQEGCRFTLQLIGTGEQEEMLRKEAENLGLQNCVTFLGTMPPAQVRSHMERSGIFLFTSDRREGWGAVLNEAMNSGCAVLASHAVGAVPFLMRDSENGMVYPSGDLNQLYEKLRHLLENPAKQRRLGQAAYETIRDTWNAPVAARRLFQLSQALLRGEDASALFADGPCSLAEERKDCWYT